MDIYLIAAERRAAFDRYTTLDTAPRGSSVEAAIAALRKTESPIEPILRVLQSEDIDAILQGIRFLAMAHPLERVVRDHIQETECQLSLSDIYLQNLRTWMLDAEMKTALQYMQKWGTPGIPAEYATIFVRAVNAVKMTAQVTDDMGPLKQELQGVIGYCTTILEDAYRSRELTLPVMLAADALATTNANNNPWRRLFDYIAQAGVRQ